jgi:hypothetical protein
MSADDVFNDEGPLIETHTIGCLYSRVSVCLSDLGVNYGSLEMFVSVQ